MADLGLDALTVSKKLSEKLYDRFWRDFEDATREMNDEMRGGVIAAAMVDFGGKILYVLKRGGGGDIVPKVLDAMRLFSAYIYDEDLRGKRHGDDV